MDDHSRYIVSFALAHHQKSNLVMEALSRERAQYGTPKEVLTDVKRATLTAMERERIADATRVCVAAPGIVRGMDGMHVMTTHGVEWLLLFGDASVAYRTSTYATSTYDSDAEPRIETTAHGSRCSA